MSPRARTVLFHAIVATTLLAAAAVDTYTRGATEAPTGDDRQTTNDALGLPDPFAACPAAIAEPCRKPVFWPQ